MIIKISKIIIITIQAVMSIITKISGITIG